MELWEFITQLLLGGWTGEKKGNLLGLGSFISHSDFPISLLPGCHDMRSHVLYYLALEPENHGRIEATKTWAKVNFSTFKLWVSGIMFQWWEKCWLICMDQLRKAWNSLEIFIRTYLGLFTWLKCFKKTGSWEPILTCVSFHSVTIMSQALVNTAQWYSISSPPITRLDISWYPFFPGDPKHVMPIFFESANNKFIILFINLLYTH